MRNLAELDWRRGQSSETGLNLLDEIWADIHQRFRAGDEYERHRILTDISGAAIYQPEQVIGLRKNRDRESHPDKRRERGQPIQSGPGLCVIGPTESLRSYGVPR